MSTNTRVDNVNDFREQSILDRNIPLAMPIAVRPERGPTVRAYFAAKHRRGEFGKFWPLHLMQKITNRPVDDPRENR